MENEKIIQLNNNFVPDVRNIIAVLRNIAIRSVNSEQVMMYWKLDERIFVEEQQGEERTEYGSYPIRNLAAATEPEFGSGFSYRQLAFCRQFYRTYPIVNAMYSQFNRIQYRLPIQINDNDKRELNKMKTRKLTHENIWRSQMT
ncbi:MAG: DUF1016 N-terminal domain-containing protein [Prevotellaceae bacterium]|jgi:hypothetical protein|nr:DUF1016 N-terminal domain-containing protein [Prevotellaceae bacterium]